jgi:hypothetical protein
MRYQTYSYSLQKGGIPIPDVATVPVVDKNSKAPRAEGLFTRTYSRGRTRTCDLRVMSPTSCQLLYPASFCGSM